MGVRGTSPGSEVRTATPTPLMDATPCPCPSLDGRTEEGRVEGVSSGSPDSDTERQNGLLRCEPEGEAVVRSGEEGGGCALSAVATSRGGSTSRLWRGLPVCQQTTLSWLVAPWLLPLVGDSDKGLKCEVVRPAALQLWTGGGAEPSTCCWPV